LFDELAVGLRLGLVVELLEGGLQLGTSLEEGRELLVE
jgi:hypothetical protein